MSFFSEEIIKLLMAIIVGGAIGAEREFRHRSAGFRTIILICLGSTLFTMFSLNLGGEASPVRIAAHMVTGVGFLCAGVIMEEESGVVGLTTAATIWFTAAMGMGIGGGQYVLVIVSFVGVMLVLWVFPQFEKWIYNVREVRTYEMVYKIGRHHLNEIEETMRQCGLRVRGHKLIKSGKKITYIVEAYGPPAGHEDLVKKLLNDNESQVFRY